MDILPYTLKWLEIVLRWSHVLFAILWVGNSFLFNYLDNKIESFFGAGRIDPHFFEMMRLKTGQANDCAY